MTASRGKKQSWALGLAGVVLAVWAVAPAALGGVTAGNRFIDPPSPVCRTSPSDEANVLTDCEFAPLTTGTAYANETTIAVNPTRPANIVGTVDDHQIGIGKSGQVTYARPRVRASDDGGHSWATYAVDWGRGKANHSQVAFDQRGTAYASALVRPRGDNPDVAVARSGDGGRRWSRPVSVGKGSGTEADGVANDQDTLAAWGDGNAIVAWAQRRLHGGYRGSPIMTSVTHDGGRTWTKPVPISGSAPFCVGISGDNACDQAQNAQPVMTADGHLFMSFTASDNAGLKNNIAANKLLIVELDPSSGAPMSPPTLVAQIADEASRYPANSQERPTLHDSQFIVSSLGNIAADPTNPAHLAEVWSDMRNSPNPVPTDPYAATTNSDIVVTQSYDRGQHWSDPVVIDLPGDQFEPSATYDHEGRLRLGYYDRSYDPANHRYGYSLATERVAGSLQFDLRQATTTLSDPTRDDHLLAVKTVNPSFPHPTLTIGGHGALAATPTGVIAYWTDLRGIVCFGRCGAGQSAYAAQLP